MKDYRTKGDLPRLGNSVLSCLLMGVAACHPVRGNDDAATTTAPQQKQVADSGQMTEGAKFLKTLHKLVLDPPVTPEKITAAFGWPVLTQNVTSAYRFTKFSLYPPEMIISNPSLNEYEDGTTYFSMRLRSEQLCVTSDEVLDEYGSQFKPTLAIVDPPPDVNTLSEQVKRNRRLFFDGPQYHLTSPAKSSVRFIFSFTECLAGISASHPTK